MNKWITNYTDHCDSH